MIKPHILFDNTRSSKKIKNFLDYRVLKTSLKKCNFIIVIGGDGFMLSSLKNFLARILLKIYLEQGRLVFHL